MEQRNATGNKQHKADSRLQAGHNARKKTMTKGQNFAKIRTKENNDQKYSKIQMGKAKLFLRYG